MKNSLYKEFIETFSRPVKLNTLLRQAPNIRGTAYYDYGQVKTALEDYRKAVNMVQASDAAADLIQFNIVPAERKKTNTER